ncbi:amidohydrolase family protein [Streptomyces avermitilis]|uniref:amidohydrolase family protein n=1 Tax=Streptomyces avermitilis TaxID=33903 RepID=UPI00382E9B53
MLDWYHVARSHDHEDAAVAGLRDAPEFATVDAAQSCGLDARTGSLTPGKDADVILLRADDLTVFPVTDPVATIVGAGHPGLVDTVLVAGRVVKRDGVLVSLDLAALRTPGRITQPDRGGRRHSDRRHMAPAAGIGVGALGCARQNGGWRGSTTPTASVLAVSTDRPRRGRQATARCASGCSPCSGKRSPAAPASPRNWQPTRPACTSSMCRS